MLSYRLKKQTSKNVADTTFHEKKLVIVKDSKIICLDLPKYVGKNLKHEIDSIIDSILSAK